MKTSNTSANNSLGLIFSAIGFLGIFLVILTQDRTKGFDFLPQASLPYISILCMILVSIALFLEIKEKRKSRKFSYIYYGREVLRAGAALAIGVYSLIK